MQTLTTEQAEQLKGEIEQERAAAIANLGHGDITFEKILAIIDVHTEKKLCKSILTVWTSFYDSLELRCELLAGHAENHRAHGETARYTW